MGAKMGTVGVDRVGVARFGTKDDYFLPHELTRQHVSRC
jgi:hypothetical protein